MQIPETRYARSGEIAIAYQVHGSGAHDIVFSGATTSNVETVWAIPEAASFFERIGRFARMIRFDRRDTGVSDPIRDDLTLEAHAADALAVMDAVDAERPVLMGVSDGARSLAALAATQPERVGGLIAVSATARGGAVESPVVVDSISRAFADLDWPGAVIELWVPGWAGDPIRRDRFNRYIRTCSTPRQAERLLRMSLTSDISQALPLIQAPTLVLRPAASPMASREAVREFAELIPGAVYREIPGDAMLLYALDIEVVADAIEEFVTGSAPAPLSSRVLATVLFSDVVGSTDRAAQLGDRAWASLLERYHASTTMAIGEHDGEMIKTLGDGVLAIFTGPAQAIRCSERLVAEARALGLEVRTGIHTGEVERGRDDLAGLAVHIAARIVDLAGGGEVLVSRTVRDLVVGSELRFSQRGDHLLKGVPDRWTLYAVE